MHYNWIFKNTLFLHPENLSWYQKLAKMLKKVLFFEKAIWEMEKWPQFKACSHPGNTSTPLQIDWGVHCITQSDEKMKTTHFWSYVGPIWDGLIENKHFYFFSQFYLFDQYFSLNINNYHHKLIPRAKMHWYMKIYLFKSYQLLFKFLNTSLRLHLSKFWQKGNICLKKVKKIRWFEKKKICK